MVLVNAEPADNFWRHDVTTSRWSTSCPRTRRTALPGVLMQLKWNTKDISTSSSAELPTTNVIHWGLSC